MPDGKIIIGNFLKKMKACDFFDAIFGNIEGTQNLLFTIKKPDSTELVKNETTIEEQGVQYGDFLQCYY